MEKGHLYARKKAKQTTKQDTDPQVIVVTGLGPLPECPEFLTILIRAALQAGSPLSRVAWPLTHDRRRRGFCSHLPHCPQSPSRLMLKGVTL